MAHLSIMRFMSCLVVGLVSFHHLIQMTTQRAFVVVGKNNHYLFIGSIKEGNVPEKETALIRDNAVAWKVISYLFGDGEQSGLPKEITTNEHAFLTCGREEFVFERSMVWCLRYVTVRNGAIHGVTVRRTERISDTKSGIFVPTPTL